MSGPVQKFTQEFKDELCKEVILTSKPIKDVAISYGLRPDTLRAWLVKYRAANEGSETNLNLFERERYNKLEHLRVQWNWFDHRTIMHVRVANSSCCQGHLR